MKKSFPANINGKIFYIDEDAYALLLDYLSQLRATFAGDEADEIVSDIEQRISEHFEERIASGANVIIIDDVNRVIETMGRPEQLSDDESTASDHRHNPADAPATPPDPAASCHTEGSGAHGGPATPPPPPIHKRLYRDVRHKVFGGVIAGLAQYLGWDVTVMRILYVVLTVCTYFWPCVIVYMVAWMIIPVARTPRQILEMQGQPVTLDNIGQTVINNSTPPAAPIPDESSSSFATFINTCFSIAAKFILGFLGIVSAIVAFVMLCLILSIIAGIIIFSVTGLMPGTLSVFGFYPAESPVISAWAFVCLFFSIMVPFLLLARYTAVPIFRTKSPSAATVITAIIFELLLITATVVLYNIAQMSGDSETAFTVVQTTQTLADAGRCLLPVAAAIPVTILLAPSLSA